MPYTKMTGKTGNIFGEKNQIEMTFGILSVLMASNHNSLEYTLHS